MKGIKQRVWLLCGIAMTAVSLAQWSGAMSAQSEVAQKYGSISGRVVRPNGLPAPRVRVAAMPIADSGEPSVGRGADSILISLSNTDDAGRFLLTGIPPGRYFIVAGALDDQVYFPGVFSAAEARILTVTRGSTLPSGDFLYPPLSFNVRGRVVREQHNAGADIELAGLASQGRTTVRTPLAPDGSFEFSNVRRGTYSAQVFPDLCLAPIEIIVDRDIARLEIPIPASAVMDVPLEFNLAVEGGGLIPQVKMLVTPKLLAPATNSCNMLPWGPLVQSTEFVESLQLFWNLQMGPSLIGISKLTFRQLIAPGEYAVTPLLTTLPPGYVLKSITAGSVNVMKETLKVTASGVPPIKITLAFQPSPPWLRVEGRVTDLDKVKVKPAEVVIEDPVLASPLSAEVRADGSFVFPMILPGDFQLIPRIVSFGVCESRFACQGVAPAKTVTIGGSEVARIEIPATYFEQPELRLSRTVPPSRSKVSGRLFIDGKAAPLRFSLFLSSPTFPAQVSSAHIKAGSDGAFSFEALAGVYSLTTPLPLGLTYQSMRQGDVDLTKQPLAVSSYFPNSMQLHVSTEPSSWATVSGRMTGIVSSMPMVLALTGGEFRQSFETPVNPDGTFRIAAVPQGRYELAIKNADGAISHPVIGDLLIREIVGDGIHKAEDAAGLEIVVPARNEDPAVLRQVKP